MSPRAPQITPCFKFLRLTFVPILRNLRPPVGTTSARGLSDCRQAFPFFRTAPEIERAVEWLPRPQTVGITPMFDFLTVHPSRPLGSDTSEHGSILIYASIRVLKIFQHPYQDHRASSSTAVDLGSEGHHRLSYYPLRRILSYLTV